MRAACGVFRIMPIFSDLPTRMTKQRLLHCQQWLTAFTTAIGRGSAWLALLLVLGTLSFRLREAGLDRATIGYLSWVGLAYGFKWCWAPLVDRLPIPLLTRALGRRRSWLLLSQFAIMAALVGMALADPRSQLTLVVWCALAVAFASATQDIALDAFRIESADANHQGALAATHQTGYRVAMTWARLLYPSDAAAE